MPAEAAAALEAGQLDPDDPMTVIAAELAGLNASVHELGAELAELRTQFDSNAKRVEDALVWVVAVVKEIREAGVSGLLRGTRRKT